MHRATSASTAKKTSVKMIMKPNRGMKESALMKPVQTRDNGGQQVLR